GRQRDGLAAKGGGEDNLVAAAGAGENGPQRAGVVVAVVQDGQSAEDGAVLHRFQARPEGGPGPGVVRRGVAPGTPFQTTKQRGEHGSLLCSRAVCSRR